jgi:hypothetical protein
MPTARTPFVAVLVSGVGFMMTSVAEAQSRLWLAPAVSLSLSHDSNLFLTPDSKGDALTQLRPLLRGGFESPTKQVFGSVSFDAQLSARYPSTLNAVAARRNAMIDAQVKTSPNAVIGLGARYDRTDSPSELNLESAILLGREKAKRGQITPSAFYRLTPLTWLRAQYDWTTESLTGYPDQSLHVARVGMDYSWSARTQWGGRYVGRSFVSPFDTDHSHTLLVSMSRQLSPGTNVSFQAGPTVRSYDGLSSEVLASFLRFKPRQRFLLDYWHGETIVFGVVGPVDIHSGTNRISWLLRNDFEINTLVGVFRSKAPTDLRAIVYHGGVGGSWRFRDMYTLTVAYRADLQQGDLRGQLPHDDYAGRGVFLAGVTIAPRLARTVRPPSVDPAFPMTGVLWP